ncbi:MAG: hypothetical protein ACFFBX_03600 [Promethearchaeota archaeon]
MSTPKSIKVLFDTGHNNEVAPDEPELSQLSELLKKNAINANLTKNPLTPDLFENYHVLVLGNPLNATFNSDEISTISSFVESGGGLLLISGATIFGKGGDTARNTNLNAITKNFDFEFSDQAIAISEDQISAIPSAQHPVVEGIRQLEFTTGTSIKPGELSTHLFRAANIPGNPTIVITTEGGKGRILAIGGATPFFNDHIQASDHDLFIVQALYWLAGVTPIPSVTRLTAPIETVDEVLTQEIIDDLRQQLERLEQELNDLRNTINTSLKEMEKVIREFQQDEKST